MVNVKCFFPPIIRSTLATETGANNPGLRLYKYDTEAGEVNGQWPVTLARKPESKNFDALASVIHQKNRIGSGFPGMCDFKSVHGA